MINIHHLELFYHVAKHRGITAASRRMPYGIQQPAISGQIAQLERTLGTNLFQRRPFRLTPGGAKLFAEIEPFFAGLNELPNQVRGCTNRRLRLAAPAIVLRDYLPKIVLKYKRRYSDFRLLLHDANQASAEELLRKREIDLAITEVEGTPGASINCSVLMRLPLVLVIPDLHKFRAINDFFRDGVTGQSLISLPGDEVISKQFHAELRKLGLAWVPAIQVSSLEMIDLYVSLGFGVGLSVALPQLRKKAGLRHLQLQKFQPLKIAAFWTSDLSELAASLLADVRALARRLNRGAI